MPSAAKSRRLREPYTFFIDRSLGARLVAEAIRVGCEPDELVHVHDDHFPQDTTDTDWLKAVGARGWVVLTKDTRMRTNLVERETILASHVAWFALARGDLTAAHMGQIFCAALGRIRTVLRRFEVPIIATVSMEAVVRLTTATAVRYGHRRPTLPSRPGGDELQVQRLEGEALGTQFGLRRAVSIRRLGAPAA